MEQTRSEEQAVRNEIRFRQANEALDAKRDELAVGGRTPYFCECEDPACTELVRLALADYEHVRSRANWFVVVSGHDEGLADRAESHNSYEIVEKTGLAGRIAEEQNPRR
jgi:hypothetical protein